MMADIGATAKKLLEQSMQVVNKAATNIAVSAKLKVDEMNLTTRRKELRNELGNKIYDLWNSGEQVPASLEEMLLEMKDLDEKLQVLRESKAASAQETGTAAETSEMATDAPTDEVPSNEETSEDDDIPSINVPEEPEKPVLQDDDVPTICVDDEGE